MPKILIQLASVVLLAGCGQAWNDPYPAADAERNILYAAFTDRPKHLDPAQSYTEDEITFTGQIYEPPLQYHYLKRPYTLIPATLEQVPQPRFFDVQGRELAADAPLDSIAESVYELRLKPGIRYQPHPAFALDERGQPLYSGKNVADGRQKIADFAQTGTRELTADDYI
ncbi:MAG: peptide ABC transporter substrate-binding protein, partial [Azonexus sp.]